MGKTITDHLIGVLNIVEMGLVNTYTFDVGAISMIGNIVEENTELLVSELESKWKCLIPIPSPKYLIPIPIPGVFQMFDSDSHSGIRIIPESESCTTD